MLVGAHMTREPIAVSQDTSFDRALTLMRERRVRRFPVVDASRQVIGIVSEKDLLNAAPSAATTLDQFEIPSLLSRLTIADLMSRVVICVTPETPLEEAARLMNDNKIGGLPVVDERRQLVGIITETDIFRAMIDMLGARQSGLRITFRVDDQRGTLAKLAGEITRQGGNIITVCVEHGDDQAHPTIMIKAEDVERERLLQTLQGAGALVIDVRQM